MFFKDGLTQLVYYCIYSEMTTGLTCPYAVYFIHLARL